MKRIHAFAALLLTLAAAATTLHAQTMPNPFVLEAESPARAGSIVLTRAITVNGTSAPSPISITGGQYSVNGGAFTAAAGTVQPLDTVVVSLTAATLPAATRQATLDIGGRQSTVAVQTYRPGMALTGAFTQGFAAGVIRLFLAPPSQLVATAGTGTLDFQLNGVDDIQAGATFTSPDGQRVVPGTYENAGPLSTPGRLGASYTYEGETCTPDVGFVGRVVIHEAAYTAGGALDKFAADFDQACASGPVRGEIRVNSTVPFSALLPSAPGSTDLSGDGKSDLVFQNTDGRIATWTMNGGSIMTTANLIGAGSGWSVTHLADLDGDRKADIFFKHTDGRVYVYQMNGVTVTGGKELLGAGLGWSISHTADLDGDGKADLILKNADGRAHIWLMNGTLIAGSATLLPAGSPWSVVGTGDLNGDGKDDIVFKNTDGRGYIYLMNGTARIGGVEFLAPASGWVVSHVADFNNDGKADLVFRHNDGRAHLFLMNGTTFGAGLQVLGPGTGWTVTHVGDLNGDGNADFVFKHTDGRAHVRLMNGTTVTTAGDVLPAGSGWSVTQLLDLNGDGKRDLMFRNADGRITVRLMDGLTILGSANLIGPGGWAVAP
jgi:hypothetical protein